MQTELKEFKINLVKIEWSYVLLSGKHKIHLLHYLPSLQKESPINMSFRNWELYEYPLIPTTSQHVWTVKTSNQLEKSWFVILGFQINRKEKKKVNVSRFDHWKISNVKLFLNFQYYHYGNLNLNIDQNQYALLYDMYVNFQNAY